MREGCAKGFMNMESYSLVIYTDSNTGIKLLFCLFAHDDESLS